jgi:sodium/potassium-transporting ATPase subunit beta
MWNSETKEFMGRGFVSWVAILSFYVFFYAFLAAFWAACLAAFLHTIDYNQPTQQGNYSLLKANPGMTFEPMPWNDRTLVKFTVHNSSSYTNYTQQLTDTVLKPYWDLYYDLAVYNNASPIATFCDGNQKYAGLGYFCATDMASAIPDECRPENDYGFALGAPCVFLRPNKIYGYKPLPYGNITAETANESPLPPASLYTRYDPNYIGITCEGENDGDKDNLLEVTFYPDKGFPFYFYPYYNQKGYLPPFVLARFRVVPGNVIMIWCRIWAANIKHDKNDLQGSIHFELQVDRPTSASKS